MTDEQRAALLALAQQFSLMDLERAQWLFKEEKIRRITSGNYAPTFDPATGTYQRDREVAYGKE